LTQKISTRLDIIMITIESEDNKYGKFAG
jgi:hypothetical protein